MRDLNRLCRRSALALAMAGLLAPAIPALAQSATSTSIPLQIVKITQRTNPNKFAYRLLITIGVDGAPPRDYLLDTGSAQFNIDVGLNAQQGQWPAWLPLGTNANLPAAQVKLYGYGYFGYLQSRTTISNIQFYDPNSNTVVLNRNTPGAPVGVNYAWLDSAVDPRISHPPTGPVVTTINGVQVRIWKPFQQALANGSAPEEGFAWGIFGAGSFNHSYPDMLTKTGYVVEANGTSTSPGTCAKACLIMGLTPEIRAQFLTKIPWRIGAVGQAPISGANESGEFPWVFNVKLSKDGTTWQGDKLPTLIDTGSMTPAFLSIYDVSKFPFTNPARKAATTPLNAGIHITLAGAEPGAGSYSYITGDPLGADRTKVGDYTVDPNSANYAILGLPFLFKNALMYDLQNQTNAYTPFYIVAVPLNAGLNVTPDMGMLGLAGVISGSGTLTIADGGVADLSAANTYTGATTVANGGWLALAGPGSIAASSGVSVDGTFDVSRTSHPVTIASLAGSGEVDLGGTALTLAQPNGTFSGVIADGGIGGGTGGSVAISAGQLTLSGTNTFTGSTSVASGAVLTLTGAGSVATSSGITVDGTLNVADVSTANAVPVLSGSGALNVQSGTLALSGANPFTGTTTIAAPATLGLDGSLGGNVSDAGTLLGTGSIGGNLGVDGAVTVGGTGKATVLAVGGNYSQGASSTYTVTLDPTYAGLFSLINVTGNATLANGATVTLAPRPAGTYLFQIGKDYPVLTASQGVTGDYTLSGNTTLSAVLGLTLAGDANHRYFQVVQTRSLTAISGTPNQMTTLGGVQSLPASSDVLAAVASLPTDAAIQSAATQLSGELYASTQTALLGQSRYVRHALLSRLREAGTGAAGASTQSNGHGATFWVQAAGASAKYDGDANTAGMTNKVNGAMVGFDQQLGQHGWLGAAVGFTNTDIDMDQRAGSASSHNVDFGVYGGVHAKAFEVRGGIAYTRYKLSSKRQVNIPGVASHLAADYDAHATQVFGEAGYRVQFTHTDLVPFVRAAWVKLNTGALQERGGAAALNGASQSQSMSVGTLGVRAKTRFPTKDGAMVLHEKLAWQSTFGKPDGDAALSFQNGQVFEVAGVPVADSAVIAGIGLGYHSAGGFSFDLSYAGSFASNVKANQFGLHLAWTF